MPPVAAEEVVDWSGVIKSTERGAQYEGYFECQISGQIIYSVTDAMDPKGKSQIDELHASDRTVHL